MTTFLDKVLFLLLIALTIASFFFVKRFIQPGSLVRIMSDNKTVYVLNLNEDTAVSVKTPLGENVIEIKDKMVHMKEASCQNKLCVHQGWIDRGAIVCLPNKVIVSVGGGGGDSKKYDAISR